MLRTTIVCLLALTLQIFALPEYIANLERDLSLLPEEYKYLAKDFNSKRAASDELDTNAYCCKNWQHINNDEVVTRMQTSLVPQTVTSIIGYQDCNGNPSPTRPPIPSSTRRPSIGGGRTTASPFPSIDTSNGCMWTPINKTETHMITQYTVITYLVPNSHTYCAPADYECCPNYVMLNHNCIHESSVSNLEFLIQLGLIGGVGKK